MKKKCVNYNYLEIVYNTSNNNGYYSLINLEGNVCEKFSSLNELLDAVTTDFKVKTLRLPLSMVEQIEEALYQGTPLILLTDYDYNIIDLFHVKGYSDIVFYKHINNSIDIYIVDSDHREYRLPPNIISKNITYFINYMGCTCLELYGENR